MIEDQAVRLSEITVDSLSNQGALVQVLAVASVVAWGLLIYLVYVLFTKGVEIMADRNKSDRELAAEMSRLSTLIEGGMLRSRKGG